ncbi:MAG: prolyl oligopeptidase family serine peptidase [Pirellulaceae bacterium]
MNRGFWLLSLLVCVLATGKTQGQTEQKTAPAEKPVEEIKLQEGWVLSQGMPPRGRISLRTDAIEWAWLNKKLSLPDRAAAESPSGPDLPAWKRVVADANGGFAGRELANGWLATFADVPEAGVWLLDTQGSGMVMINGSLRMGDIYSNGSVELPVLLQAGSNTLIFAGSRGRVAARLRRPEKNIFFSLRDTTFPHILRGETEELWGSCLLVNATSESQSGLMVKASGAGFTAVETSMPFLPPLSTRKIAFRLVPDGTAAANVWEAEKIAINLELLSLANDVSQKASDPGKGREGQTPFGIDPKQTIIDRAAVDCGVRNPTQTHRRTFRSELDGSVQYYGVVPPMENAPASENRPGLILSLHGAGVEGEGQAGVYAAKPNTYVITPTNRRSFGFDWEDWGRWDALEVLAIAQKRFNTDRQRTYLTGHSMGGHGTWHLGTLFPDKFAAIAPSAGWISFTTYAGRGAQLPTDPVSQMIRRPLLIGDTVARVQNLQNQGVYILHGDKDDNVPVDQARTMRSELAKFHPNFVYKEQPGAGHWWGNESCDSPPLINFLFSHQLPRTEQISHIDFRTPGITASSTCFWMTIAAQRQQGLMSHVDLKLNRETATISGKTENVQRLALHSQFLTSPAGTPLTELAIEIDGDKLEKIPVAETPTIWLVRENEKWTVGSDPSHEQKNPQRAGVFKEAFKNRFLMVYGTQGTPEENTWMLERARYDAETFWYRGNGSVDVVPDTHWETIAENDRNVIVYGNATINAAWQKLLVDSPLKLERDHWSLANEPNDEQSVAIWMVRPRPGSKVASVAAIGGSTLLAMQSTRSAPFFSSGTGYPDLIVAKPDFLEKGVASVMLAGFFGNDWTFENGEWVRSNQDAVPNQDPAPANSH